MKAGLTVAKVKEFAKTLPDVMDKDFYIIIHPSTHYALKVITTRAKYRHEQWIPRWEKWSGREYVETEGELNWW